MAPKRILLTILAGVAIGLPTSTVLGVPVAILFGGVAALVAWMFFR